MVFVRITYGHHISTTTITFPGCTTIYHGALNHRQCNGIQLEMVKLFAVILHLFHLNILLNKLIQQMASHSAPPKICSRRDDITTTKRSTAKLCVNLVGNTMGELHLLHAPFVCSSRSRKTRTRISQHSCWLRNNLPRIPTHLQCSSVHFKIIQQSHRCSISCIYEPLASCVVVLF